MADVSPQERLEEAPKITEPHDGAIVAWFKGKQPCAAMVRIDSFAEEDTPLARWFNVDEERGFDDGPETWDAVCKRLGIDNGPFLLTVTKRVEVSNA